MKNRARTTSRSQEGFVVDEIRVQVVVRETDTDGQTVAKHVAEPLVFVNERSFREWATQPFNINRRDEA